MKARNIAGLVLSAAMTIGWAGCWEKESLKVEDGQRETVAKGEGKIIEIGNNNFYFRYTGPYVQIPSVLNHYTKPEGFYLDNGSGTRLYYPKDTITHRVAIYNGENFARDKNGDAKSRDYKWIVEYFDNKSLTLRYVGYDPAKPPTFPQDL